MDRNDRNQVLEAGPVGLWTTGLGTASVLSPDQIEFRSDGDGLWRARSVAFGEERIPFAWRMAGVALIEIRERPFQDDDPADLLELRFERVRTDAGDCLALFAGPHGGFWRLAGPIVRVE